MNIFDKNLDLYQRAMDFRVQRHELISSNLANRETPGYLAKDVVFERELQQAYQSEVPGDLKTSDPLHYDGSVRVPIGDVRGQVINSFNPDPRKDGNTVDLDKENTKMAENTLMFSALSQMASHKLMQLKTVISEGGN